MVARLKLKGIDGRAPPGVEPAGSQLRKNLPLLLMSRPLSFEEVSRHNSEEDCWLVIDNVVYDVTEFLDEHPGGKRIVMGFAGKDATTQFGTFHSPSVLRRFGESLRVGVIAPSSSSSVKTSVTPSVSAKSVGSGSSHLGEVQPLEVYGEPVPYIEPSWYQTWRSPYFNESHVRFRSACREWCEKEVLPFVHEWDVARGVPKSVMISAARGGFLPCMMGYPFPSEFAKVKIPGNVSAEEYDYFHTMILVDELSRCASAGVLWGIVGGPAIGLPAILHFGSQELKQRVCEPVLSGSKTLCLAITEPQAGSDVRGLTTTAKLSADGSCYIVNGEKKWITTGITSDYFVTAVRTSGGLSLLVIERAFEGVTTRRIDCSGALASGTTYITFTNVKVPAANLVGEENKAFKYIGYNFNHERICLIGQAIRFARTCYEDSFKYAHKRSTFGKKLIDHPVIRAKFGKMIRSIESCQSWMESVVFQLTQMSTTESRQKLGGPIALLKVQATETLEMCVRESGQVLGGLSYTKGGIGERIERLSREWRVYTVGGGSAEILEDFGVRQAQKAANL
eukprot:TRINITY_DN10775_c0_g1_i1.p1 TRINITY_DN10775_c0_g1~~TRINITY_DN10775_c0_g1_i1.p1  ORF type:complete len:565 (+),score=87.08 TRINITY_DN10775_c0_g1_i1:68-1762(+)